MGKPFWRLAAATLAVTVLLIVPALAQQEFPPPQGKGPLVVIFSGATGRGPYGVAAASLAKLGYDAVLFDSNTMTGTQGAAVKAAILKAQQSAHASSGKAAVLGFSLGGILALSYATDLPDLVVTVIAWYPVTNIIHNPSGFVSRFKIPVLMFAGEADRGTLKDPTCCAIAAARALAASATAEGKAFVLVTYPGAEHDFVDGGAHYDASAYSDALQRTAAQLKEAFGR